MYRLAALIIGTLIALGSAAHASPNPGPGAETFAVEGWTIIRGESPMVCWATGASEGGAELTLAAEGPLFEMIVVAPDFPQDKSSYQVALSFDGKPPVQAAALGEKGLLAISVGRGEPARAIAAASRVQVTAGGHAHGFSLKNAAAALDAVARCAGQQTLAEQEDRPPAPIAGAGAWRLMVTMPGFPEPACAARIAGNQIDTIMVLNNHGDLVLIGGHNDWATWGGDVPLQLSIDGEQSHVLTASTLNNLIVAQISDPDDVGRLRAAKTLDWTIPTGHVRGKVAGLGVALDAMEVCRAKGAVD
jgi:hypothetical protein